MAKLITKRQAGLIRRGYTQAVYYAYDTGEHKRGEVISLHSSAETAQRELARKFSGTGRGGIADLSSEAACGDDIVITDVGE